MISLTYDGKLYLAPLHEKKQLNRVLDCGTGTGIWAMDFGEPPCYALLLNYDSYPRLCSDVVFNLADEHPETEVGRLC